MQWVDESSLELLNLLLSDIYKEKLLIIGTYRDDENSESLESFINKASKDKKYLNSIKLKSFNINDMVNFVS